jgi:hypothetical protein
LPQARGGDRSGGVDPGALGKGEARRSREANGVGKPTGLARGRAAPVVGPNKLGLVRRNKQTAASESSPFARCRGPGTDPQLRVMSCASFGPRPPHVGAARAWTSWSRAGLRPGANSPVGCECWCPLVAKCRGNAADRARQMPERARCGPRPTRHQLAVLHQRGRSRRGSGQGVAPARAAKAWPIRLPAPRALPSGATVAWARSRRGGAGP